MRRVVLLALCLILLACGSYARTPFLGFAGTGIVSPLFVTGTAVTGTGITGGSGYLNAGKTFVVTISWTEAATVTGGTPTLSLNSGDTATCGSGSGTTSLVCSATVGMSSSTSKLAVTAFNSNGATIQDASSNVANTGGVLNPLPGTLAIITTAPTVSTVSASPATASLVSGQSAVLTVTFGPNPVVVNTGAGMPTLCLNSGGTAVYSGGSGTTNITFNYTVLGGQSTSKLAPCASNAIVLNGSTFQDQATNTAVLTGANGYNMAGTLAINQGTSGPTCSSSGTAYYVSQVNPVGSDTNPGTIGSPFLTLNKIYGLSMGPNDCVNINSVDAVCVGYISGFNLTVNSCSTGTIHVNDPVQQQNGAIVGYETQVASQTSGTTGGAGVYVVKSWQSTGQTVGSSGSPITMVFGQTYTVGGQQDSVDNACFTFNQHNVPSGGGGSFVIKSYGGGTPAILGSASCANTSNIWPLVAIDGITGFTWYGINVYAQGNSIATGLLVANHTTGGNFYPAKTITGTIAGSAIVGANATWSNGGGDNMGVNVLLGDYESSGSTFTVTVSGNVVLGGFTAQGTTDQGIQETDYHLGNGDIIEGNLVANNGGHNSQQDTGAAIGLSGYNAIVRWNRIAYNGGNLLSWCGGMSGIETANFGGSLTSGHHIYQNEVDHQAPVGTIGGGFCDDEGIDLDGGTTNTLVEQNYIHDNFGPGMSGGPFNQGWGGNTYRWNILQNNYNGCYNNGFFSATNWGDAGNSTWNGSLYVYNNTIYDSGTCSGAALMGFNTEGGSTVPQNAVFANNIFSTTGSDYEVACFGSAAQAGLIANSFWYSNGYYRRSSPGTVSICGYTTLAAWQAVAHGGDAGATTANPSWLGPVPASPSTCDTSGLPTVTVGPQPCPAGYALTSSSSAYRGTGTNVASQVGGSMGSADFYGNPITSIPIGASQ